MNKKLIKMYIETYFSNINDDETIKNEMKKVCNLLEKLSDSESVFKGLPFNHLIINEQVKLLHFILEETEERQIVSNLGKIDADKNYDNIEINDEDTTEFTKKFFDEMMPDHEPLNLNNILITNRVIIRSSVNIQEVLHYLDQSNEIIVRSLLNEINAFYKIGIQYENLTYIKEYMDCVIDNILQIVVYRIINNDNIDTLTILYELTEEIRNFSDRLDIQLVSKHEEQKKYNILTSSHVMKYFSAYLRHRSRLKEEIGIYEVLEKERELDSTFLNPVPSKFTVKKVILSEEDIKKATPIITEGKSINKYDQKLLNVREFIDIMRVYGGRQCYSNCLQDLKVYFREIYESKITYRRQQARKIVEEYIKKVNTAVENNETIPEFDKQSQYIFVREKISRGYFREKGLLLDYYGKIEFTNNFYDLLLKMYLFYDFKDSIEFIYELNHILLNKISLLVKP